MARITTRDRPRGVDFILDGLPLRCLREKSAPVWSVESIPTIASQPVQLAEEERRWESWHNGFGWSHRLADHIYNWGTGIDTRFPRTLIMGPAVTTFAASGTVTGFFEQSSILYVVAGRYIKQVDTTDDHCETPDAGAAGKDLGVGVTAVDAQSFDGSTYVTIGNAGKMWSFDGTTWTQASDDTFGSYLDTFWAETFWALARTCLSGTDPHVSWCSEGVNPLTLANWVGPSNLGYKIGDADSAITGLVALERTLYVAKTDGLYGLDATTRTPRVVPSTAVKSTNGIGTSIDSEGRIWYPSADGMFLYSDGVVSEATPGRNLPNTSPIYGTASNSVQHKGWHYQAYYNGTDSYIMCGRDRIDEPGYGPIVWHGALVKVTGAQVQGLWITSITSPPRLYFGSGTDVSYFRLPANGDNPLNDSTYRFATSGSLYLPSDDWGIPGTTWYPTTIEIDNEGLSSTTYVQVYAKIDDADWQLIDTARVRSQSSLLIPMSDHWLFTRMALRLDFTNADSTSTPKIRAIVGRAARRVAVRDLVSTQVVLSDRVYSQMDLPSNDAASDILSELKYLPMTGPVTLQDWWTGTLRERRVLVMPVPEQITNEQTDSPAEQAARLSLLVLEEQAATPAYYGTAIYGVDRYG